MCIHTKSHDLAGKYPQIYVYTHKSHVPAGKMYSYYIYVYTHISNRNVCIHIHINSISDK